MPVADVIDELLNKAQEPTWRIQVEQGKPPVIFQGCFHKVMYQLKVNYPQFAAKALERIHVDLQAQGLVQSTAAPEVEAKAALGKRDHNICYNSPVAEERHIDTGIAYLRGIRGDLRIRSGPRVCDRISCSHNAAIYLCNDVSVQKDHFGVSITIKDNGRRTHSRNGSSPGTMLLMELRLAITSAVISVMATALLGGLLVGKASMTLACSMLSSDMIAVRLKYGVAC